MLLVIKCGCFCFQYANLCIICVLFIFSVQELRPKSAMVPTSIGWGKEYFDEMYRDVKAKPTLTSEQFSDFNRSSKQNSKDGLTNQNMYTSR